MPIRMAKIVQVMEKPQTHIKLALVCSLMSTSARPVPGSVAGTMRLKVAQLRQKHYGPG